jgi:hypothetical protein
MSSAAKGLVYFIEAVGTGRVKIGFTTDLTTRLHKLQTASAVPLCVVRTVDGTKQLEAALHRKWTHHRLGGEWFDLSALATEIQSLPASPIVERPRCVDCGRAVSRALNKRCMSCSIRHRRVVTDVKAERKPTLCNGCGATALGKNNKTGVCRPCAMRVAWASSEYRASIMVARNARRRACKHCGKTEPKLNPNARYHAVCWLAVERAARPRHAQQLTLDQQLGK